MILKDIKHDYFDATTNCHQPSQNHQNQKNKEL
jgi:hypothetical protein